jgi:hypothetical protein
MAYDPKENPWMVGLRPPEPPPAGISQALARIFETSGGLSQGLASVSPPVQERSVIEKIADATGRIRKQIADGKLNRNSQLQWVVRLLFC